MKKLTILFIFLSILGFSQTETEQISEIKKFQTELNKEYKNPMKTPLRNDLYINFKGHPFFPINLKYRITAKLTKTENPKPSEIPTSSGKTKTYREYGKATFVLDGKNFTLTLYQSLALMKQKAFEDYLFLPFRDETNEKETYGGGKYLDLKIPNSGEIVLDFNQSYHPFCAYNAYDYNCPIVPNENFLPVRIEAGVMYDDIYH